MDRSRLRGAHRIESAELRGRGAAANATVQVIPEKRCSACVPVLPLNQFPDEEESPTLMDRIRSDVKWDK
jgi:hypothetical protein